MAKFISRAANLNIILKPGIPAQPITGSPAVPTLSVRFEDGIVDIKDPELVEAMKRHPGFNSDFVAAADESHDPYASYRQPSEPAHIVTEMKYGSPAKKTVTGKLGNVPPEVAAMIQEQARELAKQMLPQLMQATLEELVKVRQESQQGQNPAYVLGDDPSTIGGTKSVDGYVTTTTSTANIGTQDFVVSSTGDAPAKKGPGRPKKS